MQFLYNLVINTAEKLLPVSSLFSDKMKLFVQGRKNVFPILEEAISAEDEVIWIHVASLGEYEQAVPVVENLKKMFPKKKIVITFFSPSGYEVKKNNQLADVTTYLPLDTAQNARHFLRLVHPEWALFIKYEFWPNYLKELKRRNIDTLLISGGFRKNQLFFKSYGSWMRSYLNTFHHFFVQNHESQQLLESIGFSNVTVSGDTRFDRVAQQIEQDNSLSFIEEFKGDKLCVVVGSSWPEDEELLTDFINDSPENLRYIIAPHAINPVRITELQEKLKRKSVLFSEYKNKKLSSYQVFIIDTVGLLSRIYSYADIAYVGGAAGSTGLHNVLEPATFGTPIIIGQNFAKFPEAIELQKLAGLFAVANKEQLSKILKKFIEDKEFRQQTGMIAGHFINSNTGATGIINRFFEKRLESNSK